MKPTVYIETSVISYLTSRPSRDLIAFATVHNCDYLLTWKCESIASATRRRRFNSIVVEAGFAVPVICTPPQLHGGVPLCSDPIIEEVWRVREEHARKYNYDIGAIAEHIRERSRSLPGERVMLAPKPFQRRASVRKNAEEQKKL